MSIRLDQRSVQTVAKIKDMSKLTRRGIRQGLFKSGKDLAKTASANILSANKSGKIYTVRVRGRRIRHQASAPGESPANLTGDLRRSISFLVIGARELEFGANTPYAGALELGNPKRNLLPRPYLENSIKDNQRNIQKHFENDIQLQWKKEMVT